MYDNQLVSFCLSLIFRLRLKSNAAAVLLLLTCFVGWSQAKAERTVVGIKTNVLYDALLSPSLGVEVGLSRKLTLDVSGNLNLWKVEGHSWKHWQLQPELRYWLCQRFAGHFVGIETHVGQYNVGNIDFGINFLGTDFGKLKDSRYQGWQGGLGLTYGYAWIVTPHWNVEASLGLGYSYTKYDAYPCATCGTKIVSGKSHNYIGVTKAALGLVYIF
ncbi:MAG: DUF3575 domain-containing protein [Muribaculaceae bacterium]|nr:DUF3575 domain-containing protein [Muribaculaceae bacterium]